MKPIAGVRLTLISPEPDAVYTGMAPGALAGLFAPEDVRIDLVRLAHFANARLVQASVTGVDRTARRLQVEGRPDIHYDLLSLNVGAAHARPDAPGADTHAVSVKPTGPLMQALAQRAPASVIILGAGVGGCELALALATRPVDPVRVTLIEVRDTLAPGAHPSLSRALERALRKAEVTLITRANVASVEAGGVTLAGARRERADMVIAAAGAQAPAWLARSGLECDAGGFVRVGPSLQTLTDARIFAAGDCASLTPQARAKSGVYAVRAAPVLADNLRRAAQGRALRSYRPQARTLHLVALGQGRSLAAYGPVTLEGRWASRWKTDIDTRFMRQFQNLPVLLPSPPPKDRLDPDLAPPEDALTDPMRCAGCGGKVGRSALDAALREFTPVARPDVRLAGGDDAAILAGPDDDDLVISTDHFRAFIDDPYQLGVIAAVHALGDVWAMGAKPQAALAHVSLPLAAAKLQARTLRELTAGAACVFEREGASLVGGHTSEGAELSVGFTVTGRTPRGQAITLAGAQAGDALVLTKALGAGVILAGHMRGAAKGRWVAHALAAMSQPSGAAADLLIAAGARAMTDVTGFGLVGHALAIGAASNVSVELLSDAPAALPGALDLLDAGVRSSLHPANAALADTASGAAWADIAPSAHQTSRLDLMFDPQTAGGLLAATPAEAAQDAVAGLRALGYDARLVGACMPRLGASVLRIR